MSVQRKRKIIFKKMKNSRYHTTKYRRLLKKTDEFFRKADPTENSHINNKLTSMEEEKLESPQENNNTDPNFHEYLKNFFNFDPIQKKFFSKKGFTKTSEKTDPKLTYEKTSQISKNIIEKIDSLQSIDYFDFFDTNLIDPSTDFLSEYQDLKFLDVFKNVLNDADFLRNEENLCNFQINTANNFLTNSTQIQENIIDLKSHFLPKMNVLAILLMLLDANESRLLIYLRALDLSSFKTSQAVMVRGPAIVEAYPIYKDAFLISPNDENEGNLNLVIVVKDKLTIFEVKVQKTFNVNEVELTSLVLKNEVKIPQIEKCCIFSQEFLILEHYTRKKLYKFSLKTKNFVKMDFGCYTIKLLETETKNKMVICYTESQKILLLNDSFEIIYNEPFPKIEKWRILNSVKNSIEMIIVRSGYNTDEKFLFLLRFRFKSENSAWDLVYVRIKNQFNDFSFPYKINFSFYKREEINIISFKFGNFAISNDFEDNKEDFIYYPVLGRQKILRLKDGVRMENDNIYLVFSNLIFEINSHSINIYGCK